MKKLSKLEIVYLTNHCAVRTIAKIKYQKYIIQGLWLSGDYVTADWIRQNFGLVGITLDWLESEDLIDLENFETN